MIVRELAPFIVTYEYYRYCKATISRISFCYFSFTDIYFRYPLLSKIFIHQLPTYLYMHVYVYIYV